MLEKAEDPSHPGAVRGEARQLIGIEVKLVCGDVLARRRLYGIEVALGLIDGDDAPVRADDIRQVERGVARTASDVEKCLAHSEAAAAPGVERARSPDAMLQPEARQLFVMGTEDVGTIFGGHGERT